jgi:AcrR family transcriptional regulator
VPRTAPVGFLACWFLKAQRLRQKQERLEMVAKKKYVSSRDLNTQATREKLLKAAIKLVNQYGMKYLTVRNICEEAGVSTGSFYHLFESKDDLILYYMQHIFATYKKEVEADTEDRTALERIALGYRFYINCVLDTGVEFITGLYSGINNPAFNFLERKPDQAMVLDYVKTYLLEGKESGEIRSDVDINSTMLHIAAIITGEIYYWCVFEGRVDLARQTDMLLQNFLKTIASDPNVKINLPPIPKKEDAII